MLRYTPSPRRIAMIVAATSTMALAVPTAAFAHSGHDNHSGHGSGAGPSSGSGGVTLHQVDLVSDIAGRAMTTDTDLINPWGMSIRPDSALLWSSNQGTDSSTLYSLAPGTADVVKSPDIRVTLPGPPGPTGPTGQVANLGNGFVQGTGAAKGPAHFIFSTIDGKIAAWTPGVDPNMGAAEVEATVAGAGFTGLAEATTKKGADQLYAADFVGGGIDVFDSHFKPVKTGRGAFHDPKLPKGYHAFNAQTLDNKVFVTYNIPDAATGREGIAPGNGVVDEFDADGHLITRIATGGPLNAPWGVAIAPASFHKPGALLVGNFGDGRISVYEKHNGRFDSRSSGQIRTASGKVFQEPGLWALQPGNAKTGGTGSLFFTAGIADAPGGPLEMHGLLGILHP